MSKIVKRVVFTVPAAVLLFLAGGAWYALSEPPVQNLPLAGDLVAVSAAEGRGLLTASSSKVDHGQLEPFLEPQIRRAFCGPATSVAVINAALRPSVRLTQTSLFNAAASEVKSELAVSVAGTTLDELAGILRARGMQVQVVHSDQTDVASFRVAAQATLSEPLTFLVVNYDRRVLGQSGAGHISPVGAFNADADRLLVLDVAARKYPHTWVPVARLWSAMSTVDSDSGRARGYLLVTTPRATDSSDR
jgi:hypothetical protein